MNVLSLFDGMSCGYLALQRAGIPITKYYASEIDKYATQVSNNNYPDIDGLGDINNFENGWWHNEYDYSFTNGVGIDNIDLIIGGSPCQGFSFAGKQLAFDDPRSKLFFKFVEILNYYKPKYFLLENVRMKKEHQDVISKYLGVEPICINSALVSAQNRVRYYWTNIPNVTQPEDRGIYLKDIIEQGVVDKDKSYCIDANYWKSGDLKQYFEKHRQQLVFQLARGNNKGFIKELDKSPTMTSNAWEHNCKLAFHTSERGRRLNKKEGTKRDDKNGVITRGYEVRPDGKTCALTTVQKDNYLTEDYVIRKLTPVECERLQTLPDNYTQGVSNTQRYKMIGNGWTVDVLAHIFKGLSL
jgi:DNA-cytosine methyltransferase